MAAVLDNWRPCCPTLWACTRSGCRPVVWQQTASSILVRFLLFWIYSALCCLKFAISTECLRDLGFKLLDLPPPCCPAGGSLRSLPALRELDLSCNKSLAGGLNHLSLHLAHLSHLESLDLHLCSLTRVDLEALSEHQQGSNSHIRQAQTVM